MVWLKRYGEGAAFILTVVLVVFTTYYLGNRFLVAQNTATIVPLADCKKIGQTHKVIIQENIAKPEHTSAKLCDRLSIINNDNQIRLIAFGPHEKHQAYDGVTEKTLTSGQSLSVTLNESGTYQFHDHLVDIVKGNITVTK